MMGSTYLDAVDGGASMSQGGSGGGGDLSWMGGIGPGSVPYLGVDTSPYATDSPQTAHQSPETPNVDQSLFPPSMGDYAYLEQPFGDFSPGSYSIPSVPAAPLGLRMGHRGSIALSDRYSITSAPSPSIYAPGGIWPTHASPAPFLPTPPMADDLSEDSAAEDDDDQEDLDGEADEDEMEEPQKRRRTTPATKSKKRPRTQLRTASRAPKKRPNILPQRPTETVEDVKARAAHNQVEQQYRKRLNAHFERLLSVLPAPGSSAGGRRDGIGEKRVSKAEVLDLATERIRTLEKQMARLERERRELRGRLAGCVV